MWDELDYPLWKEKIFQPISHVLYKKDTVDKKKKQLNLKSKIYKYKFEKYLKK